MSDADQYLRELRRALPIGCRRRLVAELREHFASAAEAGEREELTIERLGSPRALAEQLLTDVRSGALGRGAQLTAALTTPRLIALAVAVAVAMAVGALLAGRHSSPAPPAPQRTAYVWNSASISALPPTITLDPKTGEVEAIMYSVQKAVRLHQKAITWQPRMRIYLSQVPPKK